MAPINFCDTCGEKRVKEVKYELEKILTKRRHNAKHCWFCNTKLDSIPDRIEDVSDVREIFSDSDWPVEYEVTDADPTTGQDSAEEIELVTVKAQDVKQHYVDPSIITRGLEDHVLKLLDPTADPAKPFKCKLCQIECAKIYNFLRHLKIKHKLDYLQEKPYKCDHCREGFTCFTHMQEHLATHLPDGAKMFSCELCRSTFKTIYSYRRHLQIQHNSVRNRPCRYCGKLFRHISEVKGHEKIHNNLKPFICNQCHKGFRVASRLKRHQQVHSIAKPYSCHICHHKVRDYEYLKKHIKMKHPISKPKYSCSKCTYSCLQLKDMNAHKMTHFAANVSDILHQSQTNLVLESVQTESSGSAVVFRLAEEADLDIKHESDKEIGYQQEVETSVNSNLPPETIQAISKLLEEAGTNDVEPTEAVAEDVVYQCMECKYQTPDVAIMRTHMSSHLPDGPENATEHEIADEAVTYRCEDCGCTSSNAAKLYAHVVDCHQGGEGNKIGSGNEIASQDILHQQLTSQGEPGEVTGLNNIIEDDKNPKCDKCSLIFSNFTDLRIHQASHISVKRSANVVRQVHLGNSEKEDSPTKSKVKIQTTVAPQVNNENSARKGDKHAKVTQANTGVKPITCKRIDQEQSSQSDEILGQEVQESSSAQGKQPDPGPAELSRRAEVQKQPGTSSTTQTQALEQPQTSPALGAHHRQIKPSTRLQAQVQEQVKLSTRSHTQSAQVATRSQTTSGTQVQKQANPKTRSQAQKQVKPTIMSHTETPAQTPAQISTRSQTLAQKQVQISTRSQTLSQKTTLPTRHQPGLFKKTPRPKASSTPNGSPPFGTSPWIAAAKKPKLSNSLISLEGEEPTSPKRSTSRSNDDTNVAKSNPNATEQTSTRVSLQESPGHDKSGPSASNQAAKEVHWARQLKVPQPDVDRARQSRASRMQAMLAGSGVKEESGILKKLLKKKTGSGSGTIGESTCTKIELNRMTFM